MAIVVQSTNAVRLVVQNTKLARLETDWSFIYPSPKYKISK